MSKRIPCAVAVVVFLAAASGPASAQGKTTIRMPGSSSTLPFSSAVRVGDLLFLSGQVGAVPGQRALPDGIQAQTRQAMENIKGVLEYAGSSMERVVKCTVFLRHIEDYGDMNRVYASFFPPDAPPARSTLAASGLARDALVEIECIAQAGDGQ